MTAIKPWKKVGNIMQDAEGKIIGRIRLQKLVYFLEITGQGEGFEYHYHHFGPYSEALTEAISAAKAFDLIEEKEEIANWGGRYSVFTSKPNIDNSRVAMRTEFIRTVKSISSMELDLAATAAHLFQHGMGADPWEETKRRKPLECRNGYLERSQEAYKKLLAIKTPKPLPQIV